MEATPLYRLVNRTLDGQLDDVLAGYMAQGLSPSRTALRLASEYQIEVSGQTVRKWIARLKTSEAETQTARSVRAVRTAQTAQTACASGVEAVGGLVDRSAS